ncbi:MAG: tRNA (adenosine(37)-N6)-threonylcarbamoyltransferase complex ATPase subunit type 1 TsaE [Bacilli bacterium]
MTYKILSKSEDETFELAENIESEKFNNMIICLNGDLGAGKTLFTKGFANALGIKETITSPTFTYIKEYTECEMNLYHMDLYRFDSKTDTSFIEEYFNKGGICIIEWSEIISHILPKEYLEVNINIVGENKRNIIINPKGSKYENLCERCL